MSSHFLLSVHVAPIIVLVAIMYYAVRTTTTALNNQEKLKLHTDQAYKNDIIHNYEHITMALGYFVVSVPLLMLNIAQVLQIDEIRNVYEHLNAFFETGFYVIALFNLIHIYREEQFCSVLYVYGETRCKSSDRRRTNTKDYKDCRRKSSRRDIEK